MASHWHQIPRTAPESIDSDDTLSYAHSQSRSPRPIDRLRQAMASDSPTDTDASAEGHRVLRPAAAIDAVYSKTARFRGGQRVGQFVVERYLADGGTSEVYLGHHEGQPRALKILKPIHAHLPALQARLINEAEALKFLDIDGVIQVFEAGDFEGRPYSVMEYLPASFIAHIQTLRGQQDILVLFSSLARVMALLHARGIVHRDLKPQNILFTVDGEARIIDFSHARFSDELDQLIPHSTETGTFLGTREYAAPEQLLNAKAVGGRADVYSLGWMLFETLAGRGPLDAHSTEELVRRRLTERPRRLSTFLPDVTQGLDALLARMLAIASEDRPTAQEVSEQLAVLATHRGAPRGWPVFRTLLAASVLVVPLLWLPSLARRLGFATSPPSASLDHFEQTLDEGELTDAKAQLDALTPTQLDSRQRARWTQKKADLARELGDLPLAVQGYEEARRQFQALNADREQEAATNRLADMLSHQGRPEEARRLYEQVLQDHAVLVSQDQPARGDEFPLTLYRLGLISIEQQRWEQAREKLMATHKAAARFSLWQARAAERLAALPNEPEPLSYAQAAVAGAAELLTMRPKSRKTQVTLFRAQLRLAHLQKNSIQEQAALDALHSVWSNDRSRGIWAHEYLELLMELLERPPFNPLFERRAREVLFEMELRGQWRGDVHLARWKPQIGA